MHFDVPTSLIITEIVAFLGKLEYKASFFNSRYSTRQIIILALGLKRVPPFPHDVIHAVWTVEYRVASVVWEDVVPVQHFAHGMQQLGHFWRRRIGPKLTNLQALILETKAHQLLFWRLRP